MFSSRKSSSLWKKQHVVPDLSSGLDQEEENVEELVTPVNAEDVVPLDSGHCKDNGSKDFQQYWHCDTPLAVEDPVFPPPIMLEA